MHPCTLFIYREHSQLEITAKLKQNSELLAKIQEQREKIEKLTSDRETEVSYSFLSNVRQFYGVSVV